MFQSMRRAERFNPERFNPVQLSAARFGAILWVMLIVSVAQGQGTKDTIFLVNGESPTLATIQEVHSLYLVVGQRGKSEKIERNKIDRIQWAGEPVELKNAREAVSRREWSAAREQLKGVKGDAVDKFSAAIRVDVQYFDCLIDAQLALSGKGDLDAARTRLFEFGKENRESIQFLPAVELLAELEWARGDGNAAVRFYDQWEKTPWPEFQALALTRQARILYAMQKPSEALIRWKSLSERDGVDPFQRALAATGITLCEMAAGNATVEQVQQIEQKIRDTDSDQEAVLSGMYLCLGYAHVLQKQPTDALLAFLHVDTLFEDRVTDHAEALAQLLPLWEEQGRQDRVREVQSRLQEQYGGTYWVRHAASGLVDR
ncbi:MAG: hypothetical protein O2931_02605 [Planctomycetota bacterium]|nr:hypothetical protein [Planctomycetota bacterium]MDA1177666.1 hypothetical protein [Planctomycetota bacterium]